ncbi:MAG: hypothetical protein IBX56_00340 [Methylomicrobium sp.]|nr:hypothetical protein [Methylomicrobium sp.]
MADRRPIQQAHERAYVDQFITWFNRAYRTDFKVISEPNPPEAIIRSSRTTRWIEVSTAFWNDAYAKDLYSFATPGEEHKPIGYGPYHEMDSAFAEKFVSVVRKKLEKQSYRPSFESYGQGYLIVPIKHPWFDAQTVRLMKDAWVHSTINDLGCFRSVYIAFQSKNGIKFSRWPTE